MNVAEAADHIAGTILAARATTGNREVSGAYVSDLLSDVIANSREGDLWVTMQKHVNVVAVAHLNGLAAIVVVNGRQPEADTLRRAEEEGIPLVSTALGAFDVAGILYGRGIRGRRAL